MSAEATAAVFRLKFANASARLVLFSLADHHNRSTGRCFPSVKTIMSDSCLSRPTIFRALEWLETKGLIKRENSHTDTGRQTANEYKLCFLNGGGYQAETGRVSNRDGGGYQAETDEGLRTYTLLEQEEEQEEGIPPNPLKGAKPVKEPSKKVKRARQEDGLTAAERKLGEPEVVELAKTALGLYNDLAGKHALPLATRLNNFRMKIVKRIEEAGGLDAFKAALSNIPKSPFLLGQSGRDGWKVTFDFLCQEATFTRLLEGFYTPAKAAAGKFSNGRYYAPGTF